MEKDKSYQKSVVIKYILKALAQAKQAGITLYVASDPEGNNWNSLNADYLLYGDTKPNAIALGVFAETDEGEIFTEIGASELCPDCDIPFGDCQC